MRESPPPLPAHPPRNEPRRARSWATLVLLAGALACSKAADATQQPADSGVGPSDAAPTVSAECPSPDAGLPGGFDPSRRRGPALMVGEFDGWRVPVWDEAGDTGIDGAAVMVQSALAPGLITTPATLSSAGGSLCLAGNTVIVPLLNFGDYWGVDVELFFKAPSRGASVPTTPPPSNSGVYERLATTVSPWDPAAKNVIGFSFVIEGNDPALPCNGVPPLVSVESAPDGSNLNQDIFCHQLRGLVSGRARDVAFSDITRDCWEPGGASLLAQPRPAGFTGQLLNLQWLVPADETAAYRFDFCVGDIRPIYGD